MIWALLVAVIAAFTVWAWRHADSPTAFFAASRRAGPFLAGIGGTAAGLSAFVFVGGPGYFAAAGAASLWVILSAPLTGALQCWTVGEPIVELVRRHRCLTVPDLVAARFGEGWPRGLAAIAVAVGGAATLAVQIKGVAIVGAALTGSPGWVVAVAATAATVAYTAAGGMRAGLLAEAAQGVLMALAAIGLAVATLAAAGGPVHAVEVIRHARPELLRPFGGAGATSAIGLFLLFALGTCAQPHYLQKFLLLRDRAALRLMPAVMTGALLSVLAVWVGVGVGGTALWLDGRLQIDRPDQLVAAVLTGALPSWLTVVAVVAVVAAVMSTAASILNLVAAAVARDLPRACGRRAGDGLGAARWATLATGTAAATVAFVAERPVALLGILGWGTFTAALLPVMVLGLNWRGASRRGAVAALAAGPAVQLLLEAGRARHLVAASWEPGLTGAAVGAILLVVLSRWPSRPVGGLPSVSP